MSEDLEAQLADSRRRETALVDVLRAVAENDNDLDRVLIEISRCAAQLVDPATAPSDERSPLAWRCATSVVTEPAGEIELKGMARPVAIYRVTALRGTN